MTIQTTPIEVFCASAHEDEAWLRKLEIHLGLLKQQGLISLWHDRLIAPGNDWRRTLDARLETASIILLLVSANFFSSDYCYGVEMHQALKRDQLNEAHVIPILLHPVADWKDTPLAHLKVLPTNAKPITSWRNKEAALANVAAGIRRTIEMDLKLLSANTPGAVHPAIWNLPYPRNPFFLGRDEELAQLHSLLHTGQATALSQPQAISGLGGIGKTQLALEYAYRFCNDYQAVLWARAESTDALISSYISIATLLRLPECKAKEQAIIVQAVKMWLQMHHDWLLILDNADELALLPGFLPSRLGGHLLLTTRAVATGRLAHRLEIEVLAPEQGALLLLRRAHLIAPYAQVSHGDQKEQAMYLSEELGGLPLALDQVGAYLEETGMDLASYIQLYQHHRAALLHDRRDGFISDHPASVATTWLISFEQVQEKSPAAAQLLRVAAFLSPDAIPEELFTDGASILDPILAPVVVNPLDFNQALEALRAYSLIRRNPGSKTISLHRLVQAVLQDTMEEAERRALAKLVILLVNRAFLRPIDDNWSQYERLFSQAWLATQLIEQYQIVGEDAERLLQEMASSLWDFGWYVDMKALYQQLLRMREVRVGFEHPLVAWALNMLADSYWRQGKYAEAEPLLLKALQISERSLEMEHPLLSSVLFGLATVYRYQGKYEEAEQLYQRQLHIEQQVGPDHPGVIDPLNNLAALYCAQGKYAEAEPLLLKALQIGKQQSNEYSVSYSLFGLAVLYQLQGKYTEAEPFYQQTLQLWLQYYGPEHPEIARLITSFASFYRKQGRDVEAESFYQQAFDIRTQSLGSEHPQTQASQHRLTALRQLISQKTTDPSLDAPSLHQSEQNA